MEIVCRMLADPSGAAPTEFCFRVKNQNDWKGSRPSPIPYNVMPTHFVSEEIARGNTGLSKYLPVLRSYAGLQAWITSSCSFCPNLAWMKLLFERKSGIETLPSNLVCREQHRWTIFWNSHWCGALDECGEGRLFSTGLLWLVELNTFHRFLPWATDGWSGTGWITKHSTHDFHRFIAWFCRSCLYKTRIYL